MVTLTRTKYVVKNALVICYKKKMSINLSFLHPVSFMPLVYHWYNCT